MPYTTYEYYAKDFYGDIIPQESFSKYELKARFELDRYTFGRIKGLSITSSIEQCMCELMEYLFTKLRGMAYQANRQTDTVSHSGKRKQHQL